MLKVVMRCATFRQHRECVEQTYPLRSELIFYMAVNPSDYDVLNLRLRSFSKTSFNLFFSFSLNPADLPVPSWICNIL